VGPAIVSDSAAVPGVELIVTDLDGTLWWTETSMHPRVRAAWETCERRKIPILAASGRRVASMRSSLGRYGLEPPVVALNGAIGRGPGLGGEFHLAPFTTDDASAVLGAFAASGLEPCVYVHSLDRDVIVGDHPSTHPGHLAGLGAAVERVHLASAMAERVVLGFGLVGCPYEALEQVARDLRGWCEPHLDRSFDYEGASLTVAPRGVSKWVGVAAYCAIAGIDQTRVLAIGDGPNDIDLLTHAEVSVTLEGSSPAALAVAQHVVRPARDGGWADVLDLL
jgi:hydroxymethylpyrimidine pyrophosphatase-like HAD family hydrolase